MTGACESTDPLPGVSEKRTQENLLFVLGWVTTLCYGVECFSSIGDLFMALFVTKAPLAEVGEPAGSVFIPAIGLAGGIALLRRESVGLSIMRGLALLFFFGGALFICLGPFFMLSGDGNFWSSSIFGAIILAFGVYHWWCARTLSRCLATEAPQKEPVAAGDADGEMVAYESSMAAPAVATPEVCQGRVSGDAVAMDTPGTGTAPRIIMVLGGALVLAWGMFLVRYIGELGPVDSLDSFCSGLAVTGAVLLGAAVGLGYAMRRQKAAFGLVPLALFWAITVFVALAMGPPPASTSSDLKTSAFCLLHLVALLVAARNWKHFR